MPCERQFRRKTRDGRQKEESRQWPTTTALEQASGWRAWGIEHPNRRGRRLPWPRARPWLTRCR